MAKRSGAKSVNFSREQKIEKEDSIEVKKTTKSIKRKELELEILKKAIHIFSINDGKSINL